jgi:uncharacterized protein HemX
MELPPVVDVIIKALLALGAGGGLFSFAQYVLRHRGEKRLLAAQARKTEAEAVMIEVQATERIRETVMCLIEPLETEVKALRTETNRQKSAIASFEHQLKRYAQRVTVLMDGIACLVKQIVEELGGQPCWQPPEWIPEEDGERSG